MVFSLSIQLSFPKLNLIVSRIASLGLVLFFISLSTVQAANPYEVDSSKAKLVESVDSLISSKSATLSEKLEAYREVFNTYSSTSDFPILCELITSAHKVARSNKVVESPLDSFSALINTMNFEYLPSRHQNHVSFLLARFQAFDGNINTAEINLLKILNLPASDVHPFTLTSAYYMAAYCSYYTNNLERSAEYAIKAAEGFLMMGDKTRALEGYDGASTTFYKLGQIDSSLHYARKGLSLVANVKKSFVTNLYLNYAEALMGNQQIDSAFYYALTADAIIQEEGRAGGIARSQLCLANITSLSGGKQRAIQYYQKAIEQFKIAREPYHLVDAIDSLSNIYADLGLFKSAFQTSKTAFRMRDSLHQDRLQKDNDRIIAEYQRDVLKKELAASEGERKLAQAVLKKQQSERISMIGVVCTLLLLISFIYFRAITRKRLTLELQAEVADRTAVLSENSKRLEDQAKRLKESNAELERFAYIASHDLKTPLRNVTSFLGLIQRRLPVASLALVQEYLDIALSNARQMHNLVTDVLEFSRLNADVDSFSEDLKVSTTIDTIRNSMLGELQERNARIYLEGDADLVLPKGALEQILGNLIGNGLKYNNSEVPEVRVFVTEMDERVRLTIKDNGIGIDPEYHERIFEVFRRLHTTDSYSGTGVGLATCRKLVSRLRGAISLESCVGEGSTFHVDIPRDVRNHHASRGSFVKKELAESNLEQN